MGQTLLVVDHNQDEAERLAMTYRTSGWDVHLLAPEGEDVIEFIAAQRPLAAVFCLACGDTAAVESLATRVLGDSRALRPLMVFLGGDHDEIQRLKAEIPVGVFVREEELPWVLKHLAFKF